MITYTLHPRLLILTIVGFIKICHSIFGAIHQFVLCCCGRYAKVVASLDTCHSDLSANPLYNSLYFQFEFVLSFHLLSEYNKLSTLYSFFSFWNKSRNSMERQWELQKITSIHSYDEGSSHYQSSHDSAFIL